VEESRDLQEAGLEVGEGRQDALQTLNDATYDSGSHVEQTRNYEESEAIETAFAALVDNTLAKVAEPTEVKDLGKPLVQVPGSREKPGSDPLGGTPDVGLAGMPGLGDIEGFQIPGPEEDPFESGMSDPSDGGPEGPGLSDPWGSADPGGGEGIGLGFGGVSDFEGPGEGAPPGDTPGGPGLLDPAKGPGAIGHVAEPPEDKDVDNPDYPATGAGVIFAPSDVYKLGEWEGRIYDNQYYRAAGINVVEEPSKTYVPTEKQTPRPDGDDGTVQPPKSEDDFDWSKVGGILVTDPAYTQGGRATSGINITKHPGQVTDPTYEGSGGGEGGGLRPGAEMVTDPPEPAAASKDLEKDVEEES
jgi:hypothetical protein